MPSSLCPFSFKYLCKENVFMLPPWAFCMFYCFLPLRWKILKLFTPKSSGILIFMFENLANTVFLRKVKQSASHGCSTFQIANLLRSELVSNVQWNWCKQSNKHDYFSIRNLMHTLAATPPFLHGSLLDKKASVTSHEKVEYDCCSSVNSCSITIWCDQFQQHNL